MKQLTRNLTLSNEAGNLLKGLAQFGGFKSLNKSECHYSSAYLSVLLDRAKDREGTAWLLPSLGHQAAWMTSSNQCLLHPPKDAFPLSVQ